MTWGIAVTGAVTSGNTTSAVNVAWPPGINPQDTLFLVCVSATSSLDWTISDATLNGNVLINQSSNMRIKILWKAATGSETGNIQVTGNANNNCFYQIARFPGGPSAANFIASIVNTNNASGSSGGNINRLPSLSLGGNNNCLIVACGAKNINGSGITIPAPLTTELGQNHSSNGPVCFAWDYQIQTTATDIVAGGWNISSGDATAPSAGVIFAILPAPPIVGATQGEVPSAGNPALSSPRNPLQFQKIAGYGVAPAIETPIAGIWASSSVIFGSLGTTPPLNVGFIPQPGPGSVGPFNNSQFLTSADGGTSNPSATLGLLTGAIDGNSVLYWPSGVVAGQLNGIWASSSTISGSLLGLAAGTLSGLSDSTSVFYGQLIGIGTLGGEWDCSSLWSMRAIGGSFQPLVPMTAVVDVRMGIGYQPWKVHPNDVIG